DQEPGIQRFFRYGRQLVANEERDDGLRAIPALSSAARATDAELAATPDHDVAAPGIVEHRDRGLALLAIDAEIPLAGGHVEYAVRHPLRPGAVRTPLEGHRSAVRRNPLPAIEFYNLLTGLTGFARGSRYLDEQAESETRDAVGHGKRAGPQFAEKL